MKLSTVKASAKGCSRKKVHMQKITCDESYSKCFPLR